MLEQPKLINVHAGTTTDEIDSVPSNVNNHTPNVTERTVNMTPVNNNTHPTHINNPLSPRHTLPPLSTPTLHIDLTTAYT